MYMSISSYNKYEIKVIIRSMILTIFLSVSRNFEAISNIHKLSYKYHIEYLLHQALCMRRRVKRVLKCKTSYPQGNYNVG